ncbi:sigma-70 family RNA polymerase sigma factor [Flavivirga aquimarina]|uniref:Sigma-70 family RNA polymerase sigma factor n=1 Tax=Flavivirga aquimarina TaxID=2027862 RepID=A0ABT8W5Q8_9FLAO|nr:sigma-70 family RNA polymerase sigma factor [Flavivirga aquimarina]MDO5968441.1 sigma-70 family RNA polymerase sigma factor [Flavivirga aquimarina]
MKNYQNKLFPYAYNVLGSVEDAKDAIQDVLVKYLSIEKTEIENEMGYLIKAVVNQSINIKKKKSKITVNKMWLPEPFATENADDNINSEEIISYSLLVLLEKLTPKERAVFILKEVFDYSHKEVAKTIDTTIENSRKILSRTKIKLVEYRAENQNSSLNTSTYFQNYIHIIKNGDVKSLEKILSEDISLSADGGSKIKVIRELTTGKRATSNLLLYVYRTYQKLLTIKITTINHQPALLFYQDDTLINCQIFELENNKIKQVFSVIDPEKLSSLFL